MPNLTKDSLIYLRKLILLQVVGYKYTLIFHVLLQVTDLHNSLKDENQTD